jgi:DNA-binding CsgD family transcriptional regulator
MEQGVYRLTVEGKPSLEIAEELHLGVRSVYQAISRVRKFLTPRLLPAEH